MTGAQELVLTSGHRVTAAAGASGDARRDAPLEVIVLHTTTKATLQALRTAARLAEGLAARIRLLVLEIVPYPLPLDEPQVPLEFTHRRFRTVAADTSIDTQVDIRLGRDKAQMLESALKPHSLVVLAAKGGWWPTAETRLAKRLERMGHQVVVCRAETVKNRDKRLYSNETASKREGFVRRVPALQHPFN